MYAPVSAVQALFCTRETLKVSCKGTPDETAPVTGSVRISDRLSFSSTKYGPSVSAAVSTHDVEGLVVVPELSVVSVPAAVRSCEAHESSDWETTTLTAVRPARPRRLRRLICALRGSTECFRDIGRIVRVGAGGDGAGQARS